MKILNNVNTEKVIGLDIETVRIVKDYADLPQHIKDAWEYDNKWQSPQKLAENTEEDLSRLWENSASFKAEYSKICSISLVFVSKGILKCKEFASEDEYLLLTELANTLNAFPAGFTLCGHATKFFDFSFLCRRFMYNRIPIPAMLDQSDKKPWEQTLLCTNDLIKSFGTGPGGSLISICIAFGIPFSKSEISGADVGTKYFEGKLAEVSAYCSLDTIAGFNVLRAFKGEPIFLPENVVYVNKGEILKSNPVITEIREKGKLTPAVKKKAISSAKGLSIGEKNNLVLLIKAALNKKEGEFLQEEVDFFQLILK